MKRFLYGLLVFLAAAFFVSEASAVTVVNSRLSNISARGYVGSGDNTLIVGFVIGSGNTPRQVLIRGIGPTLALHGISSFVANPKITLYNSRGVEVASNDNWGTPINASDADATTISAAASCVGAFSLTSGSLDATILTTLNTGAYTVIVSSADGGSGIALAEVYDATDFSGIVTNVSPVANVTAYGAVSDGLTDNSAFISAALASLPSTGGTLYFPSGTYLCGTIQISGKSNILIRGDGWSSTTIRSNAYFSVVPDDGYGKTAGSQVLNISSSCSNVEVTGLTFDGNCYYRKPGQFAISINSDGTYIHDCYTVNSGEFANSFGRDRSLSSQMTGLIIKNISLGFNWADGINVHGVNGITIMGIRVDGTDDDMIALTQSSNATILDCDLRSGSTTGQSYGRGIAMLDGTTGATIKNVRIENVKQSGIYFGADGGDMVSSVVVSNVNTYNTSTHKSTWGAVHLDGISDVSFENCSFAEDATSNLIQITNAKSLSFDRCSFTQQTDGYGLGQCGAAFLVGIWASDSSLVDTLSVANCSFNLIGANIADSIVFAKDGSGAFFSNVLIKKNTGIQSGYLVFARNMGENCKILNNTATTGTVYFYDSSGGGAEPTTSGNQ